MTQHDCVKITTTINKCDNQENNLRVVWILKDGTRIF